MHAVCVPGKRIIEGGFGGDAMKTAHNPSQARLGRRADPGYAGGSAEARNELAGIRTAKCVFLQMT
jgi:hypothetical protein